MTQKHIQQDISIIQNMIEKTNQDMAESGTLFIFIGIACIVFVSVITTLELLGLFSWVLPVMLSMTVVAGLIGFLLVRRIEREVKVQTYAKKISRVIVVICSAAMLITGIVFPLTHVYAWPLSPLFAALLFGIILFTSGAVNELSVFYWGGAVAWAGALVMAYTLNVHFPVRAITMIIVLIAGFILPGICLNRKIKKEPVT